MKKKTKAKAESVRERTEFLNGIMRQYDLSPGQLVDFDDISSIYELDYSSMRQLARLYRGKRKAIEQLAKLLYENQQLDRDNLRNHASGTVTERRVYRIAGSRRGSITNRIKRN